MIQIPDTTVTELQEAAALRSVEEIVAVANGSHYWLFSIAFAAGPPEDDMVIDLACVRGATVVECTLCGATSSDQPCPGES